MSGKAWAAKDYEWFRMSIESQISVNVATTEHLDGSVSGPAEYFESKKKGYLIRMDKLEPELSKILKHLDEQDSVGLLPYDPSLPEVHDSDTVPCNIIFTIRTTGFLNEISLTLSASKPLTEDTRKCIHGEVAALIERDTVASQRKIIFP